ncbi:MAG TPA: hypothetical protein EYQ61_11800 [Dehalococcoidia bacterium]|jgi:hypothetical protein|nr:hypothetical protein [Dehalococcoidia bacterium]HIK90321.1 hypothetical protein [Dehalococcoidia bacterium]
MTTYTHIDQTLLNSILDRLLPAIDELASAGQMNLSDEIVRLAAQQARFNALFTAAMNSFSERHPSFDSLDSEQQDDAIRSFEANNAELFDVLLSISYIVYYKDSRVHERIGWSGKSPQPDGNEMEPWDESVLENMRKREPFWRRTDV